MEGIIGAGLHERSGERTTWRNGYQGDHFGSRIRDITMALTGVRVGPHLFRDAAATTLARHSPKAARLIKPVLAHLAEGTAERHYIDASTIEAGRAFASVVARRRKGLQP